ncbi:cation channel family protein (macronuclear) [Tetrahymena thermophila SB210]|uniref:Cation channel family protein n=1 Tax=Tetrahymena thermophila (strain SB210) TaxID=312017 RepID=Q23DY9_TETTS|nr:cation channel family protein [Tetrahymena thermophila SB210]EAR94798.2 cation channel family protein [Tetrahymena thermophila SB210]|eukprot:XP_001015043.2 cation channel family protein [Tetrahymena thermophila SB210]
MKQSTENNQNDEHGQQKSSKWIQKLKTIFENELPSSSKKKQKIKDKKVILQTQDSQTDDYEENSDDVNSQDMSFLQNKKDKKKEQLKFLYEQIAAEMNQKDDGNNHDEEDLWDWMRNQNKYEEKDSDEQLIHSFQEQEAEFLALKEKEEQNKFLDIVEMNEYQKIQKFNADTLPRKIFKQIWSIKNAISQICNIIINSKPFEYATLCVILFNCVILAMDDPTTNADDQQRLQIDLILLILYTVEMGFKILALGFIFNKGSYMRDMWNILDITIIITGYLPYVVNTSQVNLSAVRSLRVLRPLRTISRIKALKQILNTLFSSFSLLKDAIIIIIFFYLVFAIAGQQLFTGCLKKRCFDSSNGIQFGDNDQNVFLCIEDIDCYQYAESNSKIHYICGKGMVSPFWDTENFDTFGWALLNVYVVVSQEGWSTIQAQVQQTFGYPSFIYFMICVLVGNMFLENLLMAIIQIKYEESERLLKKRQKAIEDVQSFNLADFIRWGIYKSNKQVYKELEEKKIKKVSTLSEIISFFKQGAQIKKLFTITKSKSNSGSPNNKDKQIEENIHNFKSIEELENQSADKNQAEKLGKEQKVQQQPANLGTQFEQSKPLIEQELQEIHDQNLNTFKSQETNLNLLLKIPMIGLKESQLSVFNNYNSNFSPTYSVAHFSHNIKQNQELANFTYEDQNLNLNKLQKSIHIKDLDQMANNQQSQFPKFNPIMKRQPQYLKKSSIREKSPKRGYQRKNSRKMTTKKTMIIKPLEGTQTQIRNSVSNNNNTQIRLTVAKNMNSSHQSRNPSEIHQNSQLNQTNFQRDKSVNQNTYISNNTYHQGSNQQTIMLQPSVILKSKQNRNSNVLNILNSQIIPARKVESDEGSSIDSHQNKDFDEEEQFFKEIEKTYEINQKLNRQLELKETEDNQYIENIIKDRQIERNYRQKTVTLDNLINNQINKQPLHHDQLSLSSIQESYQKDTPEEQNLMFQSIQKRSFKKKREVSIQGQLQSSEISRPYDPESPKKAMSSKRIKQLPNIPSASLNTSSKIQKSSHVSIILENSLNNSKQKQIRSASQTDFKVDSKQSILEQRKNSYFYDGLFSDEDFDNVKQFRKQISKKTSIASKTGNNKNKKELQKKKSVKDKNVVDENPKVSIINQVLSKDEGQLYRKLFLKKDVIARVLYKEPTNYDDDILPKEKLIKKEKKKQDRLDKLKKMKFSISYQAEKRVKLRSQVVEEKKKKMEKMKFLPIKANRTALALIHQQPQVYPGGVNPLDLAAAQNKIKSQTLIGQQNTQKNNHENMSQGTYNRAPSIVQQLLKQQTLILQKGKIDDEKVRLQGDASQKNNLIPQSALSLEYFENQEKIKKGLNLIIPDSDKNSQSNTGSQQVIEANLIQKKGTLGNNDQSDQLLKANLTPKTAKGILKIKSITGNENSNLNTELNRSQTNKQLDESLLNKKKTSGYTGNTGRHQGDNPAFEWDLIKAREMLFPTDHEEEEKSQRESEFSQVFGDNASIFNSILDESKSKNSFNSSSFHQSYGTSSKFESSSMNSYSMKSQSKEGKSAFDETNADTASKRSKYSKNKDDTNSKAQDSNKSKDGKEDKGNGENQDYFQKPQTLEQFLKEPLEKEYVQVVKQQVNNLIQKGQNKIKSYWSGDDVLVATKVYKQQQAIKTLMKCLNYPNTITEQNEGGFMGIVNAFRRRVRMLVQTPLYENLIMIAVVMNTVILSLDGSVDNQSILDQFNQAFTYIFAIDMGLKLIGLGFALYCADRMNIFDGLIVILSIFDIIFLSGSSGGSSFSAFRSLRILRVFRVLRVTRLLRSLKFMKILIKVISSILDKLFYIILLLILYIFIYTLIGMQLYGGSFLSVSRSNRMVFDSFLQASFSVYDLLTIENWNNILYVALRTQVNVGITCIYLISCIFIGNFIIMNLVLATMIGAFNSSQFDKEKEEIANTVEIVEDLDLGHTTTLNSTTFMNMSNSQSRLGSSTHSFSVKNRQRMLSSGGSSQGYSDEHSQNNHSQHSFSKKSQQIQKESFSREYKEKASSISDSHNQSLDNKSSHNLELQIVSEQEQNNDKNNQKNMFKQQAVVKKDEDDEKEEIFLFFDNIKCQKSLYIFSMQNKIRRAFYFIVKNPLFDNIILAGIILNSVKLVSDTYDTGSDSQKQASQILDIMFTVFFSIESCLKIVSYGFFFDENSYLRDNWSKLDFFVVVTSIIDVSLQNGNFASLKILRLLRTLRPLRVLHHNKSMKLIVTTLLESIVGILNMLLVIFLVWLMFAILGVSLMGGKLQYCNFPNNGISYNIYKYNQSQCSRVGGSWQTYDLNFDNVPAALLNLFVISTFEGWPAYVFNYLDGSSDGPVYFGSAYFSIYIVFFILVGSFFSIDLFGAVLSFHYDIALQKSKNKYLSSEQTQWIELQRLILQSKPDYNSISLPTNKFRKFIWNICESQKLEIFIMICIIGNIVSMALSYDTSPSSYDTILQDINLGFSIVFITECLLKLIAYGFNGYFYKSSNQFDFFVVSVSVIDIIFTYSGNQFIKFLSAGPQIARIFRVFRVTRLLRLIKQFEGLQKLMSTLIYALPSLTNATALLFLIYFIFAILACYLYSPYQTGNSLNSFQNFSTFHRSYLLLFRMSTGEDWYLIMFDIIHHTNMWSAFFFVVFIIIQQYIMMSLFILIIIEQFENNYINPDNPINDFQYSEEDFKKQWVQFTRNSYGIKIHERFITDFYFSILRPLGFDYKSKLKEFVEQVKTINQQVSEQDLELITGKFRIKQKQLAEKEIMKMNIRCDYDGYIFYNELLYYFFKHSLYDSVFGRIDNASTKSEYEKCIKAEEILYKEEHITRRKLRILKKKQAALTKQKFISSRQKEVNPMVRRLFVGMCFKSWLKYSQKIQNNIMQDYDDISSQTDSDEEYDQLQVDPEDLQNALAIDKFYTSQDKEENIIEVLKNRRFIIPRLHTIKLRKQDQKEQIADGFFNGKYFEFPNPDEIYKAELENEQNINEFEERINEQQKQLQIIKNNEQNNKQMLSSVNSNYQERTKSIQRSQLNNQRNNTLKLSHAFNIPSKRTSIDVNNLNLIHSNNLLSIQNVQSNNQLVPKDQTKLKLSLVESSNSLGMSVRKESIVKKDSHNVSTPKSQLNLSQVKKLTLQKNNSNSPRLQVPLENNRQRKDSKSIFSMTPQNRANENENIEDKLNSQHLMHLQATPITFTQFVNSKNFMSSPENESDDEHKQQIRLDLTKQQSSQIKSPKKEISRFGESSSIINQLKQDFNINGHEKNNESNDKHSSIMNMPNLQQKSYSQQSDKHQAKIPIDNQEHKKPNLNKNIPQIRINFEED